MDPDGTAEREGDDVVLLEKLAEADGGPEVDGVALPVCGADAEAVDEGDAVGVCEAVAVDDALTVGVIATTD
jgi:hypothetical protein